MRLARSPEFASGHNSRRTKRVRLVPAAADTLASVAQEGPMARYDAIVLGLGAFGSAALYHLARGGVRALGIDRFDPPHPMGSTHGLSRVTRTAIGEGVEYTPLALRSHQLWRQIEQEHGRLTGRP